MSSSITLDAKEKSKVKKAIRNSSNKVLCSAQARIYYAYASTRQWCYAGLQGALAVVRNKQDKTLHFQLVDLDGTGGVIWEYEIHDGLLVEREKSATFFLSFEGDVRV
ncbi:hypothetical protein M413DRAFT_14365 [Hebeloma cylindrosporum]|uniref:WH1 domain-containing protein n=1 Tax=Hebeloma cylindrosporum TaxID=76867 RepID=A0A0C3BGD5_HEBCY|nr:hypothetical protein M413DRAFT_14365 [Hebeloma cylindrosporum h7]